MDPTMQLPLPLLSLLLFQLLQLTAIGLIGAQLARKQRALANSPTMEKCINRMHVQHTNLKEIVECMAHTANLTAFMEDTLWKLDLLVQTLDRHTSEHYTSSPYVHVDDVLKIKGSVTGYSCVGKQQVMQAIRRKLANFQLLNGQESTLFDWPLSRPRMRTKNLVKTNKNTNSLKEVKTNSRLAKELSCLISQAIERQTKPW